MSEIDEETIARALEQRRRELIEQPLARIWPDLARVALALLQPALERARREADEQKQRADRLQAHLDARPAMNAGLADEYAKWSGRCYLMDSEGIYRPERAQALCNLAAIDAELI